MILIKIKFIFQKREGRLMRISDKMRTEKYPLALATPRPLKLMRASVGVMPTQARFKWSED